MTKNNDKTDIAVIKEQVSTIKEGVKAINLKLEADYITRQEFEPIKRLAYGIVGIVLTAVVLGVLAFIIRKPI